MSAPCARRPGLPGRIAATILVAVLIGLSAWTSGAARADTDASLDEAVEADDDVREATEALEAARERAAALAAELDDAAGRYERARAHRLRLQAEADDVAADVARAEAAAADAEAGLEQQIAAAYKRPGSSVEAGWAVLDSPSSRDALHRVALVGRLVDGEQRVSRTLAAQAERAADARAQHRTIEAGVADAEQAAADAAADLEAATQAARRDAADRAEQVDEVERRTRERLAAERAEAARRERLAAEQAGRIAQARGTAALPGDDALAGMACPVAEPNAFIDSWHFPRSGGRRHLGVDIFADYGLPVYAVADGTVRRVWNNRLGGLSIDLVDERGDRYYYAHLSAAHVTGGERVTAGERIADNGNSGNARATPPHVHWQYHPADGDPVNPYPLAAMLCR